MVMYSKILQIPGQQIHSASTYWSSEAGVYETRYESREQRLRITHSCLILCSSYCIFCPPSINSAGSPFYW